MHFSATEKLTFSTVRIECQLKSGEISNGTGFFFHFFEIGESFVPVIVTNKHVIENAVYGRFYLNLADSNGQPTGQHAKFTIEQFELGWIKHPDSDVDLCIFPMAETTRKVQESGRNLFIISLDKSLILSVTELAQLTALEEIIMIGYPNGIWDAFNNKPIIRRGITATHPNLLYNGKEEFMIDAACFPGSSGSPVFLFNPGGYANREDTFVLASRLKFLGVLYAGPQHTATGEIKVINIPTQQKSVTISRIPNNLGLIIKAHRLIEFENIIQDEIQKQQNS